MTTITNGRHMDVATESATQVRGDECSRFGTYGYFNVQAFIKKLIVPMSASYNYSRWSATTKPQEGQSQDNSGGGRLFIPTLRNLEFQTTRSLRDINTKAADLKMKLMANMDTW